jgi:hypothetical protein
MAGHGLSVFRRRPVERGSGTGCKESCRGLCNLTFTVSIKVENGGYKYKFTNLYFDMWLNVRSSR